MYSNAIAMVIKDKVFSQNDMDNAFDIFTSNPWVAETYAAILDEGTHSHY